MKGRVSKSYTKSKVEGNYKDLLNSIKNGAKLEKVNLYNKTEYWINYPAGGCHRISVTNFAKLSLIN